MSKINLTGWYLYQSVSDRGLHKKCTILIRKITGCQYFQEHSFFYLRRSIFGGGERVLLRYLAYFRSDSDCKTYLPPLFLKVNFLGAILEILGIFNFVNRSVLDCMSSFGKKSWLQRPGSQVQVGDEWCRNSKNGEHIILGSLLHPLYFSQ